MKKSFLNTKSVIATIALLMMALTGCNKKNDNPKAVKIGIAKIVQHIALDQVESGIMDAVKDAGIEATFDLQNANGDVNTAASIANQYKNENVAVAVGIATPVAVSLATVIKDTPVVFATVTDPVGAGLVSTVEHGENNVTGLSDAVPTDQHIKLFKEIAGIKTLGYIYTSNEDNSISSLELVKKACEENGLKLVTQSITNSSEVKQASQSIVDSCDGIYLTTDNTVFSALPALVQVFGDAKKPIFSADVTGAKEGGCLVANGFNYYKAGRATGEMVVEVLQGKKPADMPVKFMTDVKDTDFLLDLDVAKNCGITIDQKFIDSANYIFENGKLTEK